MVRRVGVLDVSSDIGMLVEDLSGGMSGYATGGEKMLTREEPVGPRPASNAR